MVYLFFSQNLKIAFSKNVRYNLINYKVGTLDKDHSRAEWKLNQKIEKECILNGPYI